MFYQPPISFCFVPPKGSITIHSTLRLSLGIGTRTVFWESSEARPLTKEPVPRVFRGSTLPRNALRGTWLASDSNSYDLRTPGHLSRSIRTSELSLSPKSAQSVHDGLGSRRHNPSCRFGQKLKLRPLWKEVSINLHRGRVGHTGRTHGGLGYGERTI